MQCLLAGARDGHTRRWVGEHRQAMPSFWSSVRARPRQPAISPAVVEGRCGWSDGPVIGVKLVELLPRGGYEAGGSRSGGRCPRGTIIMVPAPRRRVSGARSVGWWPCTTSIQQPAPAAGTLGVCLRLQPLQA